ncbi:hypothetical protein A2U01_0055760, partial [Trifolium medium]|nr:hypothetical protein [Trifolium medium]
VFFSLTLTLSTFFTLPLVHKDVQRGISPGSANLTGRYLPIVQILPEDISW